MKGEEGMKKETAEKLWNLLSEKDKDVIREIYQRQKKEREETLNKILKGSSVEEFYIDLVNKYIHSEENNK